MKVTFIAILAAMSLINNANADITCVDPKSPDIYVEVSGNPLQIFAKTENGNSGYTFLVEVEEKEMIQGENDHENRNANRVRAELQLGLRRQGGTNATLTLRTFRIGLPTPLKEVYSLKCKGSIKY